MVSDRAVGRLARYARPAVALAQLAVNSITGPPAGARETRRVTRPRGPVAAAVWDYAGETTLVRTFWDAAVALNPRGAASS